MKEAVVPARPRIDPRIRKRRIEVQRREGRRRLRGLVGTGAVVLVAALAVVATRSPLMDVDYVDVRGAQRTTRADVLRVSGLAGHPLLIDVDTADVAARVRTLPWVATATAVRRWPRSVEVQLTERTPAAVVPVEGKGWALVDGERRVLAFEAQAPPGLPALAGVEPPVEAGDTIAASAAPALEVAAALPDTLRAKLGAVALLPSGEIELRLQPRGIVRLGSVDALRAKLEAAATVVEQVDVRNLAVLDVRVPRAPVVTRQPGRG